MTLVVKQIQRQIARLAPGAQLISHAHRDWRAITFSGSKHELVLRFSGEAAVQAGELMCDALPDHPFRIPGHMVVEAAVIMTEQRYGRSPVLTVTIVISLLREI